MKGGKFTRRLENYPKVYRADNSETDRLPSVDELPAASLKLSRPA